MEITSYLEVFILNKKYLFFCASLHIHLSMAWKINLLALLTVQQNITSCLWRPLTIFNPNSAKYFWFTHRNMNILDVWSLATHVRFYILLRDRSMLSLIDTMWKSLKSKCNDLRELFWNIHPFLMFLSFWKKRTNEFI